MTIATRATTGLLVGLAVGAAGTGWALADVGCLVDHARTRLPDPPEIRAPQMESPRLPNLSELIPEDVSVSDQLDRLDP